MEEKMRARFEFENKILTLIDEQDLFTRSDLQGAVGALVMNIMLKGEEIYKEELRKDLSEKFDEHDLAKIF